MVYAGRIMTGQQHYERAKSVAKEEGEDWPPWAKLTTSERVTCETLAGGFSLVAKFAKERVGQTYEQADKADRGHQHTTRSQGPSCPHCGRPAAANCNCNDAT